MSVAYHHMKMRMTTVVVHHVRHFCDGCNVVLGIALSPLRRLGRHIAAQAAWVPFMLVPFVASVPALIARSYVTSYYDLDERTAREEERVRLCLQKGIDPYPTLQFKEYTYGNVLVARGTEEQRPEEVSWEAMLIEDMQRRREELRVAVGGSVNDSIVKLRAAAQKVKAREVQEVLQAGEGYVTTLRLRQPRADANVLKS